MLDYPKENIWIFILRFIVFQDTEELLVCVLRYVRITMAIFSSPNAYGVTWLYSLRYSALTFSHDLSNDLWICAFLLVHGDYLQYLNNALSFVGKNQHV